MRLLVFALATTICSGLSADVIVSTTLSLMGPGSVPMMPGVYDPVLVAVTDSLGELNSVSLASAATDPHGNAQLQGNLEINDITNPGMNPVSVLSSGSLAASRSLITKPNQQVLTASSPMLSGSAMLLTNTPYSLFLETDSESDGSSMTPKPSSKFLFAAGTTALPVGRAQRS